MSPTDKPDANNRPEQQSLISVVVRPKPKDIGDFEVRRTLPSPGLRSIGPFVFFDEMGPANLGPTQNMDVRPHPHINLATITYLFDGAIHHRDSLGSSLIIRPGAVNLMVAGRGITHSERTPSELRGHAKTLHGLQLWIALPEADEEVEPSFHHYPASDIPAWEEGGAHLQLVMGSTNNHHAPVKTHSPTIYMIAKTEGVSEVVLPDAAERAIYIVDGEVNIGDETHPSGTMIVFKAGSQPRVQTRSACTWVLIGGAPIGTRHLFWNFVSSRKERIEAAKSDWRENKFPVVVGDESERIPLPQ